MRVHHHVIHVDALKGERGGSVVLKEEDIERGGRVFGKYTRKERRENIFGITLRRVQIEEALTDEVRRKRRR